MRHVKSCALLVDDVLVGHDLVLEVQRSHVFGESVFVPLVDALLEQVKTLTAGRDVEDHEENKRERYHDRNRDADPVEELKVGIYIVLLLVWISH